MPRGLTSQSVRRMTLAMIRFREIPMLRLLAAAFALALALPAAAQEEIGPPSLEREFFKYGPPVVLVPACDDAIVQRTVRRHFRQAEKTYWKTGLVIQDIDGARQTAWRPNGPDVIPRRYCRGTAVMSDGRRRAIDYSVIEEAGIIGLSWGVQWCVHGLDRHNAYAPGCLMARP